MNSPLEERWGYSGYGKYRTDRTKNCITAWYSFEICNVQNNCTIYETLSIFFAGLHPNGKSNLHNVIKIKLPRNTYLIVISLFFFFLKKNFKEIRSNFTSGFWIVWNAWWGFSLLHVILKALRAHPFSRVLFIWHIPSISTRYVKYWTYLFTYPFPPYYSFILHRIERHFFHSFYLAPFFPFFISG